MYEKITDHQTAIVVADELRHLDDIRKRNLWLTLKASISFLNKPALHDFAGYSSSFIFATL